MIPLRGDCAYYNDFDEGACAWLEELIREGLIAPGVVDRRMVVVFHPLHRIWQAVFEQCQPAVAAMFGQHHDAGRFFGRISQ